MTSIVRHAGLLLALSLLASAATASADCASVFGGVVSVMIPCHRRAGSSADHLIGLPIVWTHYTVDCVWLWHGIAFERWITPWGRRAGSAPGGVAERRLFGHDRPATVRPHTGRSAQSQGGV